MTVLRWIGQAVVYAMMIAVCFVLTAGVANFIVLGWPLLLFVLCIVLIQLGVFMCNASSHAKAMAQAEPVRAACEAVANATLEAGDGESDDQWLNRLADLQKQCIDALRPRRQRTCKKSWTV